MNTNFDSHTCVIVPIFTGGIKLYDLLLIVGFLCTEFYSTDKRCTGY